MTSRRHTSIKLNVATNFFSSLMRPQYIGLATVATSTSIAITDVSINPPLSNVRICFVYAGKRLLGRSDNATSLAYVLRSMVTNDRVGFF